MSLLVIDDHEITRTGLVRLLKEVGYSAVGFADGERAIHYLKDQKPSLILLDLMMPGTSGLDFLEHLRRDARLSSVPVIVFSAADYAQSLAMGAGANKFLLKGVAGWQDLIASIEHFLGRPQAATCIC